MLEKLFYVLLFVVIGLSVSPQIACAQKNLAKATRQTVLYMEKGAKITLHGNSEYAAAYQWFRDSTKLQGETAKDIVIRDEGTFNVLAFNQDGCPSEMSDDIKIVFTANSDIDLAVDIQTINAQVIAGQRVSCQLSVFNKSTTDATGVSVTLKLSGKFLYQPEPTNPLISYDDKTQVITWGLGRLKAGAKDGLTLNIKATQSGQLDLLAEIQGAQPDTYSVNNTKHLSQQIQSLTIPNVFTPNGDGMNDTFAIPGLEAFAESEITIANRAGANVFTRKNYKNDWSGDNLPEGTYFYLLRLKDTDGTWQVYKSYITLLRSKL